MDSENTVQETTLILKRLEEPLSGWGLLLPVGALVLLYMVLMYQRSSQAAGPFWSRTLSRLLGPPWALILLVVSCGAYLFLGHHLLGALSWWLVLVPIMTIAFIYVGCMYYRDARAVGITWATFLGLLRSTVYILLAGVFLLPAWQESSKSVTRSKVVVLIDVTGSMGEVDDLPQDGQDLATLLTRQDKVIRFLTADQNAFLRNLQKSNPVTCYRFGQATDEQFRVYPDPQDPKKKEWSKRELDEWLKIDPNKKGLDAKEEDLQRRLRSSTNIGDSLMQVFNKESGNMVQAIILISDGQNNEGKEQTFDELRTLAEKSRIPLMCIGVGKYKPPVSIKINDLEAPKTARPDDPFTIQVPVLSQGLKGKDYELLLEISRVEDSKGNSIKGETYPVAKKTSTHKDGEPDRVEFEINVEDLKKLKAADDKEGKLEGTWEFKARVARDKREVFAKPFHVSDQAARVKVTKKKIRALILAGGPSKEYQFVKNLFYREAMEKRMEVGVYLQTAQDEEIDLDEDKPQLWMLDHFPDLRARTSAVQKPYTLFDYDLVIAFDPDWMALPDESRKLLHEWVRDNAGGIIVIGGPVNTEQLTKVNNQTELLPILNLYPVILGRYSDVGLEGLTRDKKYALKFPGASAQYEFLKLDEAGEGTTAGWNEFFYGTPDPAKGTPLENGMYSYFPVTAAKAIATVIAQFPGETGAEGVRGDVPYLVSMQAGSGKSVFLGSDEIWRLRMYKEAFHDRFWLKLARFVGSGNLGRVQKFGESYLPERYKVGEKQRAEYKLWGSDRKFFARDRAPELKLHITQFKNTDDIKPDSSTLQKFDMKPKAGRKDKRSGKEEDTGWFVADFPLKKPGKYEFELKIPGTPETMRQSIMVDQPNPELDNVRPDLLRLYNLAREDQFYHPVQLVLNRVVDDKVKSQVRKLKPPAEEGEKTGGKEGESLYFELETASLIPNLLITDKDEKETKGEAPYLWDQGWDEIFGWDIKFSYVMGAIVLLLSLEWLTRKLLKLA